MVLDGPVRGAAVGWGRNAPACRYQGVEFIGAVEVSGPDVDRFRRECAACRGADCTTAFVLNDEGNRITILDPWLTGGDDYSYRMATPMGGRLRAQALGSAGSVTFIVDRYGHLFTRNWDFDQSGADQIFFRYSYEDQRGKPTAPDATVLVADNLAPVHGFAAYQLPASGWVEQPAIDGTITDRISIQKIDGQTGSAARILRVEGERNGETGYWEKPITANAWTFVGTGDPLRGNTLAQNSNAYDLAAPSGISYSAKLFGAEAELHDFDTAVADNDLILRDPATGATATLVLHTVDGLRPELSLDELTRALRDHTTFGKRSADLDGTDRKFYGVLELPDSVRGALPGLPESLRQAVEYLTGGRNSPTTAGSRTGRPGRARPVGHRHHRPDGAARRPHPDHAPVRTRRRRGLVGPRRRCARPPGRRRSGGPSGCHRRS